MFYIHLYTYIHKSEGRDVNSKFWSLGGATDYTGFQSVLKVEVTTLGHGLNIVLGEGRVLRPRVKASCSIINSGKIKHSRVKLNKMTVGHGKKETSRALLFRSFSTLVQSDGNPKVTCHCVRF